VDEGADVPLAVRVCVNAKAQRPGVCNAMETLLVHEGIASAFLPEAAKALSAAGVAIRGCPQTVRLVPGAVPALASDWGTEYLDLILAVRVVPSMDAAMEHIRKHGSLHTEAILTRDHGRAMRFLREVDSSLVLVNASTRFNDGYQLGLGRRSASARRRSTPSGRWGCPSSPRRNSSPSATARCGSSGRRRRRIALFGGTFDPFHNGHLRMAVEVLEGLAPADLFLVPSARPPHKPSRPMAPAEDRLAMASAAVAGIDRISVLDLELRREGPSYSLLTVREISGGNPGADLLFLIGPTRSRRSPRGTGTPISSRHAISCSSPGGDRARGVVSPRDPH